MFAIICFSARSKNINNNNDNARCLNSTSLE